MLCVSIYEDFCFARFQPTHLLRPKMCSGSFGRVDHTIRKAEQNVARVNWIRISDPSMRYFLRRAQFLDLCYSKDGAACLLFFNISLNSWLWKLAKFRPSSCSFRSLPTPCGPCSSSRTWCLWMAGSFATSWPLGLLDPDALRWRLAHDEICGVMQMCILIHMYDDIIWNAQKLWRLGFALWSQDSLACWEISSSRCSEGLQCQYWLVKLAHKQWYQRPRLKVFELHFFSMVV